MFTQCPVCITTGAFVCCHNQMMKRVSCWQGLFAVIVLFPTISLLGIQWDFKEKYFWSGLQSLYCHDLKELVTNCTWFSEESIQMIDPKWLHPLCSSDTCGEILFPKLLLISKGPDCLPWFANQKLWLPKLMTFLRIWQHTCTWWIKW